MSGFDDFLDPLYDPPFNQTAEEHVIGTTLTITITPVDGDGASVNFSSGYTAVMTPYVNKNTALTTFTQAASGGRQIVLGNGFITVTATPAASTALFGAYVNRVAKSTLIVTRTSDGAAAPMWVECTIPLLPKLNP